MKIGGMKMSWRSWALYGLLCGCWAGAWAWEHLVPGIPANQGPGWLGLAGVACIPLLMASVFADNPGDGGLFSE